MTVGLGLEVGGKAGPGHALQTGPSFPSRLRQPSESTRCSHACGANLAPSLQRRVVACCITLLPNILVRAWVSFKSDSCNFITNRCALCVAFFVPLVPESATCARCAPQLVIQPWGIVSKILSRKMSRKMKRDNGSAGCVGWYVVGFRVTEWQL